MKFGNLPVGQRFRWRDSLFVKTSPILATAESDGRSQLVPRSAPVEQLEREQDIHRTDLPPQIRREIAVGALAGFHQDAGVLLERLRPELSPAAVEALRQGLDDAHRRALEHLQRPRRPDRNSP